MADKFTLRESLSKRCQKRIGIARFAGLPLCRATYKLRIRQACYVARLEHGNRLDQFEGVESYESENNFDRGLEPWLWCVSAATNSEGVKSQMDELPAALAQRDLVSEGLAKRGFRHRVSNAGSVSERANAANGIEITVISRRGRP
jgi:hypothetical protein